MQQRETEGLEIMEEQSSVATEPLAAMLEGWLIHNVTHYNCYMRCILLI